MALIKADTLQGFNNLPAFRQLFLMIGMAASIALGVAIVLWSQTPDYTLLFNNLDAKDSGRVLESLQKMQIRYRLDSKSGAILVPSSDVHKARIRLAKEGLPQSSGMGLEFLKKEESFRTSKFTQYRRYIHAREIELARSISTMQNVESARVHLALPERSSFIGRKEEKPKATVVLKLYGGRSLRYGQVKAIVHMVASSISGLDSRQVSVIDQHGKLLTRNLGNEDMALTEDQLDYKNRLEHVITRKVEDIVGPIVGAGRVRAKVDVDLDLSRHEQYRTSYNPDSPAVTREVIRSQRSSTTTSTGGKKSSTSGSSTSGKNSGTGSNSSNNIVRHYAPDKTITRTNQYGGRIKRLSIAVLVDDKRVVDEEGTVTRTPMTKKEIINITELVKSAVGFNEKRGDTIKVSNATFYTPPPPEALPEVPFMERPWVGTLFKQLIGIIAVLVLFFAVLRPVLRSLAEKGAEVSKRGANAALPHGAQAALPAGPEGVPDSAGLPIGEQRYEDQINFARQVVGKDPGRVAQVVRNWVSNDG